MDLNETAEIVSQIEMDEMTHTVRNVGRANAKRITSALDVYEMVRKRLRYEDQEEVFAIMLNCANKVIDIKFVALGGTSSASVSIKQICRYAVMTLASGVILVHTHPSGNTTPSHQDDRLTCDLNKALKMFEISLCDHVIIGDGFYSYANDGRTMD